MAFEDIAMMRTVPNAYIFDIVDGVQVRQECTRNKKTLEQYDVRNVSEQMKNIYTELLGD